MIIERKPTGMDYIIKLSTLPQNELWTIEQSEIILNKAFQIGIPRVKSEEALLELVKQAYQWDKNAMIQYAKILGNERGIEPEYETSLVAFLKKYSDELVDKQGNPLEPPAIFDLSYNKFMQKLADKGYSEAMIHVLSRLSYSGSVKSGTLTFKTLEDNNRTLIIIYLRKLIKQGYKYNSLLANALLFSMANGFKDSNAMVINKLNEHLLNLSEEQKREAIGNYHVCAIHGNQYCMVRLAEAYYYGIGTQQDYKQALAWSQMANQAYQYFVGILSREQDKTSERVQLTVNSYNQELINLIKEYLTTHEEVEQADKLVDQLRQSMATWDFDKWADDVTIPVQL